MTVHEPTALTMQLSRRLAASVALVLAGLFLPLGAIMAQPAHGLLTSAELDATRALTRVAFGSCFKASRRGHEIWSAIEASRPQLFLFAGDTLYPSVEDSQGDLPALASAYATLASNAPFAAMREHIPVLPVWDDHDYGLNDGGAEFELRDDAKELFLDFFAVPADDPRRSRPGLHTAYAWGPPSRRVQLILLE